MSAASHTKRIDRLEVEIRMLRGSLDAITHGAEGDAGKLAAIAGCALRGSRNRVVLEPSIVMRNLVSGELGE